MSAQKAYKGMAMEGVIASWYARTTVRDLHRHKLAAEQMTRRIPQRGRVLEIAPGPGFFCIELAKLGDYQITGLDISKSFVAIAQKNAREAGVDVEFKLGDAANMPFGEGIFDLTFCQAAFKNFSRPVKAIEEMYRVLKPGGVAVILDMRHDAPEEAMDAEVDKMNLGAVNKLLVRWTFQQMLVKSAYSLAEFEAFVAQTPFKKCRIEADGIGFRAWLEKK